VRTQLLAHLIQRSGGAALEQCDLVVATTVRASRRRARSRPPALSGPRLMRSPHSARRCCCRLKPATAS